MLTINADDFGRCALATDRILECFAANRISGASAMVFMEDSERATALAMASGLDVGLHINFTESFTGPNVPLELRMNHERIRRFLRTGKYALLIYNPILRKAFREVFTAQVGEFARLYGREPLRFDGHHHMHLCSNMILDRILPFGAKVRRSFSFSPGERSFANRYYRRCVDRCLVTRHQTGDFFFILSHHLAVSRLQRVIELATTHEVELLTHPEVNVEYEALMSAEFANAISRVHRSVERSPFASALPADSLTTDNGHLTSVLPHLSICICTCGRPAMLERLLRGISRQETAGVFTLSIVVSDNDSSQSARSVVEALASQIEVPIVYCVEAERNIAAARNSALSHATGDFIVFVDDDEFPAAGWLLNLFRTYKSRQVAGVLGPVKPHFDHEPPQWLIKGGFYQRPSHPTGFVMPWQKCRTGNVLFRRDILDPSEPPFRREFGGGGEDQDFFRRMIERGHRFVWCDEAVIYEVVPPSRWSRRFMIHRALFRGQNTLRHPKHRLRNLFKSVIAVPAYALALPVLLLAGHHYFMKYVVKLADHLGLLLASVGLNPVTERRM